MNEFISDYRREIIEVASRAAKTFVQSLTAQLTVAALLGQDYLATRSALIAAFAAGFSVIWNALQTWANSE